MATDTSTATIGQQAVGRRMTLDEFLATDSPEGFLCELARGVVIELEMPALHRGRVVERIFSLFSRYEDRHPGRKTYRATGANRRISLPGLQSHRRRDHAVYLLPNPSGRRIRSRWIPQIVVEVSYRDSEHRDYVEKREEYLRFGVLEYWIFDQKRRTMRLHKREDDVWFERDLAETQTHRTELLPGLEVSVGQILGPGVEVSDEDDEGV